MAARARPSVSAATFRRTVKIYAVHVARLFLVDIGRLSISSIRRPFAGRTALPVACFDYTNSEPLMDLVLKAVWKHTSFQNEPSE